MVKLTKLIVVGATKIRRDKEDSASLVLMISGVFKHLRLRVHLSNCHFELATPLILPLIWDLISSDDDNTFDMDLSVQFNAAAADAVFLSFRSDLGASFDRHSKQSASVTTGLFIDI